MPSAGCSESMATCPGLPSNESLPSLAVTFHGPSPPRTCIWTPSCIAYHEPPSGQLTVSGSADFAR